MTLQQSSRSMTANLSLSWQRVPWWGQCLALWLAVNVILSAAGVIGVQLAQSVGEYTPSPFTRVIPRTTYPGIWIQWDAGWYLAVVSEGYAARPDAMGYFPLYPLLVSSVSSVTGLIPEWSGVLVAQVFYLAAILAFYKLARRIRDDHAFAMRAVLYLALFPTSFFFLAGYAESTYMAFAILAVYLAMSSPPQILPAGIMVGLAAGARPTGWPVGIVLLTEFFRARDFSLKATLRFVAAGAAAIAGIVLFILYLYSLTGSFTAINDAQSLWKHVWQFPLLTLWNAVALIFDSTLRSENWFLYVLNIFDLAFGIFAIAFTLLAVRWSLQKKFSWSLTSILVVSLLFMLTRQGFQVPLDEMARWAATLFPVFLMIAMLTDGRAALHRAILAVSGIGLLLLTMWWCTGRWVG